MHRSAYLPICAATVLLTACGETTTTPREQERGAAVPEATKAPVAEPSPATTPEEAAEQAKARREQALARLQALKTKTQDAPNSGLWERGEAAYKKQNWKDARVDFQAFALRNPTDPKAPLAVQRATMGSFALGEYAEGLTWHEDMLELYRGTITEARLLRTLANTLLAAPHWGTQKGGELLRGRWDQGTYRNLYRSDRARAVRWLEQARDTSSAIAASAPAEEREALAKERVAIQQDLVSAIVRFTPFDVDWSYWYYAWAETPEDDKVDEEGPDERVGRMGANVLVQSQPRGLPVDATGQVIFTPTPPSYRPDLPDTAKIKFLLREVAALDPSPNKDLAAAALYRQALLFRARDGSERLSRLANWWWGGSYPYQSAIQAAEQWKLKDDQVLGLIATHVGVIRVPEDESTLSLLRRLIAEYPRSSSVEAAKLAIAAVYQSRGQLTRARLEYQRVLDEHPKGDHSGQAHAQIALIEQPGVELHAERPQLAGGDIRLPLEHRNLTQVYVRAVQIDLERFLGDFRLAWIRGDPERGVGSSALPDQPTSYLLAHDQGKNFLRYARGDAQHFELSLPDDHTHRAQKSEPAVPLKEAGLWILELFQDPQRKQLLSRGALMLEDSVVLVKSTPKGSLLFAVDGASGQPIASAKIEIFEYWMEWKGNAIKPEVHHELTTLTTDASGLAPWGRKNQRGQRIISLKTGRRFTWATGWSAGYYAPSSGPSGVTGLMFTDRPVYRPLDKVEMQVWARAHRDGKYQPPSAVQVLTVDLLDPKGAKVFSETQKTNDHGGARFTFPVPKNAALGLYHAQIRLGEAGAWVNAGGSQFRVEEYKTPELEVTVDVGDGPAKLGTQIPAIIRGRYYFGGAVEGAKVSYRVYRTESNQTYSIPGSWDWLYGPGYGRAYYPYPWFGWWVECGPRPWRWYPWWGPEPEARRELVQEGAGTLDHEGALRLAVDTTSAKERFGDHDQRFIVEAEVTDSSRRTIRGQGEVLATRNQFFVHLETDRGYYDTGSTMSIDVRTLLPTGAPIATKGELRVAKVALTAENGTTMEEAPIFKRPAATDEEGRLTHRFDAQEPGQYRLSYVTQDAWGSEVTGSILFWVWGPELDGRRFRFNHLELITDRRTYQVGETVRLLISSDVPNAHVLFSPRAEGGFLLEPQVVALQGKTKVVELLVTEASVPNFFVEASLVGAGKISEEVREVFVPPPSAEVQVSVRPKSAEVKPGQDAELEVHTFGPNGHPIPAEVAVSVFDRSVLYIQPELTPDIRRHFWARLRTHHLSSASNLARSYPAFSPMSRPEQQANWILAAFGRAGLQGELDFSRGDLSQLEGSIDGLFGTGAGGGGSEASGRPNAPPASAVASSGTAQAKLEEADARASGDKKGDKLGSRGGEDRDRQAASDLVTPEVRRSFADTALFSVVKTDAQGSATLRWKFPDNVGSWRVRALAMTQSTQVGEATGAMTSAKKLMVRLESPRFFRERDRVMISAIVHNRLGQPKKVRVRLSTTETLLAPEGKTEHWVEVGDGKEARVDFWVNVKGEGDARVTVAAETDQESDAKELTLPVLVHGMEKTVSAVGSISAEAPSTVEHTIELEVPAERRKDQTRLVLRWAPTLAGAMIDALPFLLDYPYGCTEQTVSRFVPAVITRRVLKDAGGLALEDLEKLLKSTNPQQLPGEGEAAYRARLALEQKRYGRNPIYDTRLMNDMITTGLARLEKMQRPDGGWGWWGSDGSSIYTTAYVLAGLAEAQGAGLEIPSHMIARGRSAMRQLLPAHLNHYSNHDWVSDEDAYFAYVMSLFGEKDPQLNELLLERRARLTGYGKSLFSLALSNLGRKDEAALLAQNAAQRLKEDPENETAWLETRAEGWWWWWNDEIETNAMFLRAILSLNPKDARAPKLVKWLLNHRQNGWYWRSTRDTAVTLGAFAHFLRASGEGAADYTLEVSVDGQVKKQVRIDPQHLLTFDGELTLAGDEVGTGKHRITFKRTGKGAVYFNAYLSYFTLEEDVPPAGLEIKVERRYFRLVRDDRTHDVYDQRGQATTMKEAAYRREPLASGDQLTSGDLVLVELSIESKNDYAFLAFEDPKPAGMEPVALRSGVTYGEAVANLELRDEKVVFFLRELNHGQLKLSYRLRAEIPGAFHALPARAFAMYAPELKANSSEMRVGVVDASE